MVLSNYYLKRFSNKYDKPNLRINSSALEKLMHYPWPGNVRELLHTIERSVILAEGNVLRPDDFLLSSKHAKWQTERPNMPRAAAPAIALDVAACHWTAPSKSRLGRRKTAAVTRT